LSDSFILVLTLTVMRLSLRTALVAALVPAVVVPMGTASAHRDRDHKPRFSALIFSKTPAFRHNECIPQGTVKIAQMGVEHGFNVDATENADAFTDANLAKYDVVIWLCTTGDVLNATQQAAFERYIRAGGGYAGIHSASDAEYDWPWYGGARRRVVP
jgi:cytochrome c